MIHLVGQSDNVSKLQSLAFFNTVYRYKFNCSFLTTFVNHRVFSSTNFVVQYVILHVDKGSRSRLFNIFVPYKYFKICKQPFPESTAIY